MDELNLSVLLDNKLHEEMRSMAPWYSIPNAVKPFSISNHISLLSTCNGILSNYLRDTEEYREQDTIVSRMEFKQIT